MDKLTTIVLVPILFMFTHLFAKDCAAQQLTVGVIAGFTGEWAQYGEAIRQGIEMQQLQNKNSPALIKFLYEDDQFIPRLSVSAAQKLLEVDKVDALIVGDTTTALALVPQIQRKHIPMIAWATDNNAFKNNPYIIRTWPPIEYETSLVRKEITQQKYKSIALWAGPHDYAVTYSRSLKTKLGTRVREYEEFGVNLADYRSSLIKVRALGVDSLGLCLNPGQHALVVQQAHDMRYEPKIFGCNMLNYSNDIKAFATYQNHPWIFDTTLAAWFIEQYLSYSNFGTMPNTAAVFFDVALTLQNAAERGSKDAGFANALRDIGVLVGANGQFTVSESQGQRYFDFTLHKKEL